MPGMSDGTMAANESKKPAGNEGHLTGTIAAFQQLLEVIPDDPLALESLFEAYREAGEKAEALKYLDRLIAVLLQGGNTDVGNHLRSMLHHLTPEFPEVASRVAQLDVALHDAGRSDAGLEEPAEPTLRQKTDIQAELALAWRLFQAGELTQEEYASVAQDLTELSANDKLVTVSVLHVLQDRGSRNLERIVTFASRDSGLPLIPLNAFEAQPEAVKLLPRDFSVRRGVIAFELLGPDALVAVLNPYNRALRDEVTAMAGRPCHFYLALPVDFDALLERLSKREEPVGGPAAVTR